MTLGHFLAYGKLRELSVPSHLRIQEHQVTDRLQRDTGVTDEKVEEMKLVEQKGV